jgi:hypothetical protein
MKGACDTPSGHGRVNLTTVDTTDVGSEVRVAGRWVEVCLRAFSAYMGRCWMLISCVRGTYVWPTESVSV